MKNKHILLIAVIIIAIIAALSAFFVMSPEKTISYDFKEISFNSTVKNITSTNESDVIKYCADNVTITVSNVNSLFNATVTRMAISSIKENPSQTVDGIIIYNTTATQGEFAGDIRYSTLITKDNTTVLIFTDSIDETLLIAKSLVIKNNLENTTPTVTEKQTTTQEKPTQEKSVSTSKNSTNDNQLQKAYAGDGVHEWATDEYGHESHESLQSSKSYDSMDDYFEDCKNHGVKPLSGDGS